jgi:hypothetical protein
MRRPSRVSGLGQFWIWGGSLCLLVCTITLLGHSESAHEGSSIPTKIYKPQVPLLTQMALVGRLFIGREAAVDLQVQSLLDAPTLRIAFKLPDGLRLSSSTDTFVDTIAKGETKHFQIRFVLPDANAYEIIGTATLELPDGARLARAASLTIQAGQQQTSQTEPPVLKKSRDHENIIEFKAD